MNIPFAENQAYTLQRLANLRDGLPKHGKLKYETRFEKLKTSASVPKWRIPYSADIHPQVAGGLSGAGGRRGSAGYSLLSTYDRAFHSGGGSSANSYETQRVMGTQRTLFPGVRFSAVEEARRKLSECCWHAFCSLDRVTMHLGTWVHFLFDRWGHHGTESNSQVFRPV
jgi:hypothetical protein